jgi:hypothetical protein
MPPVPVPPEFMPGWAPEQREKWESTRKARRFYWRNRHVTIPLSVAPVMLAAADILHAEHLGMQVACGAVVAAVVAAWRAPRHWDRTEEVAYAQATTIAGGLWLTLGAYLGDPPAMKWALAGGSLAWGIPFWQHKRPRDKRARRDHARQVRAWNEWWQMHAPPWGVAGSGVVDVKEHAGMESLLIQLWAGRQTQASIRAVIPLVESALGGYVDHGMTRLEVNKSNPSQAWLHLKREDPLREEIEWDPSMAPGDIMLPVPAGTLESGGLLEIPLRRGFFILGATRTGKSNQLSVLLAAITKCRNARVLLIDMKGGRAARPWLPAVDWMATTIEEARLVLACALAEVKARGGDAYNGEDEQLDPTDDCPTLFVVIDETHEVTSTMSGDAQCRGDLALIASQGAGVEVYPIVLTQFGGLNESVGTEQIRSNLPTRMCFQTAERRHGTFALGDDAHSKVDTTTLVKQGQFYYRANAQTHLEQVRGPHVPHKLVKRIAIENAASTDLHSRPLRLYATGWQEIYDMRWTRLPRKFWNSAPQVAHLEHQESSAVTPAPPPREPDDIDRQVAEINEQADAYSVTDADIARAMAQRAARGEGPPDLRADHDKRRRIFAAILQGAPAGGVRPSELEKGAGLGHTWVALTLRSLVSDGVARKPSDGITGKPKTGKYVPVGDVWDGLESIRLRTEQLGAEAREMAAR